MRKDMVAAFAAFSKEEFQLLKLIAKDRENLHDTYEEWRESVNEIKRTYQKKGLKTLEVPLTVFDINAYCAEHGLENTGSTRSRMASERAPLVMEEQRLLRKKPD